MLAGWLAARLRNMHFCNITSSATSSQLICLSGKTVSQSQKERKVQRNSKLCMNPLLLFSHIYAATYRLSKCMLWGLLIPHAALCDYNYFKTATLVSFNKCTMLHYAFLCVILSGSRMPAHKKFNLTFMELLHTAG